MRRVRRCLLNDCPRSLRLSQGAYEYTGLAAETLLPDGFDCLHPEDRQPRRAFWKKLLKTEEPGELEMRVRGADGSYRWFATRSYSIRDANGKLERWASLNWDIDEHKRAETADQGPSDAAESIAGEISWVSVESGPRWARHLYKPIL